MSSRREAAPHTRVAAAADRGRRGRFGRIGRRRALGGTGGAAAPCDRPPGLRVSQRRQAARAVRLIVLDGALASAPCRGQGGARSRHRSRQPPPAGTADRRAGRRAARPGAARQRSRCRDAGPGNDPARTAAGAATPGHGPGGGAPACGVAHRPVVVVAPGELPVGHGAGRRRGSLGTQRRATPGPAPRMPVPLG